MLEAHLPLVGLVLNHRALQLHGSWRKANLYHRGSPSVEIFPQWTLGNVWTHFWLSLVVLEAPSE